MIDNRTSWRSRRWAGLVGAPVAVVALLGLAACGTSTDTSTSAAASASAEAPADDADDAPDTDLAAYRSCLEENGVSMPEPSDGGTGAPSQGGAPPSGAPRAGGGSGGPGGSPDQAPPGVDEDTWAAAQEACSDLAPTPPGGTAPTASPAT